MWQEIMLILLQYYERCPSLSNVNKNNNNLRFGGVWGYGILENKSSNSSAQITNNFRDHFCGLHCLLHVWLVELISYAVLMLIHFTSLRSQSSSNWWDYCRLIFSVNCQWWRGDSDPHASSSVCRYMPCSSTPSRFHWIPISSVGKQAVCYSTHPSQCLVKEFY
jgi:hypothetical protein